MPTISVIVPIYNVEKYIHRCVDSILGQTFSDFELILVDDGSPDNCGAICDEYAAKDNRVRVIHQENGGLSAARNAGIDCMKGEYLSFVDSDDWIQPRMLEIMLSEIRKRQADMVICGLETVKEDPILGICHLSDIQINIGCWEKEQIEKKLASQAWYYIIACNKIYHRHLFRELRFPMGYVHEDAAIMHRIFGRCDRVATISDCLYCYLQRSDSIMGSDFSVKRTDNLTALADRICYASEKRWNLVCERAIMRYVPEFFDMYFRFPRNADTEKYFVRMENSLKMALPHIIKSKNVSLAHKLYLCIIRISPQIYVWLRQRKYGNNA